MSNDKLIPDLIVKVFEHHKTHARFEESQRTLFVAAYFTVTGVLAAGVISAFTNQGAIISGASKPLAAAVLIHLALGIFIAFAVAKVSGEFRRHFQQAEKILNDVSDLGELSQLSSILKHSALETAGHQTASPKNKFAQFFSVAAAYNYILSLFIALDIAVIILLMLSPTALMFYFIFLATFLFAAYLQHKYIKFIEAL